MDGEYIEIARSSGHLIDSQQYLEVTRRTRVRNAMPPQQGGDCAGFASQFHGGLGRFRRSARQHQDMTAVAQIPDECDDPKSAAGPTSLSGGDITFSVVPLV